MPSVLAIGANGQVLKSLAGDALHVQYGNCTLTLSCAEFHDLCQMLEETAAALEREHECGETTSDPQQKV
ncbi:MAG: hypothetical protein C4326_01215 [Ignavibacteria bacterium]